MSNPESPCPDPAAAPKDPRPCEWVETQDLINELFRRFPAVVVVIEFVPDMASKEHLCARVTANCSDSHVIGLLNIANGLTTARCLNSARQLPFG